MKKICSMMIVTLLFFMCSTGISGSAVAASLDRYLSGSLGNLVHFQCDAVSPAIVSTGSMSHPPATRSSGFSMGKLHKYTGYGTIIAAVAAGVSGSDNGFHKGAGDMAAALAVATCITGFSEYRQYFDMDEGWSAYNIHIVLATVATAGFVATAIDANSNKDTGHAGLGIGSAVLMTVPIVILHF